jgi:hypothetical protein
MFTPDEEDVTEYKRIQASARALKAQGKSDELIKDVYPDSDLPEIPKDFEYLLDMFRQLSQSRNYIAITNGMDSVLIPQAISFQEVQAYVNIMQIELDALEAEVLRVLDEAFLDESAKLRMKRHNKNKVGAE